MKLLKRKIVVIVEKTRKGFSAYAEDFPVGTTGRSIPELQCNILEALNLYYEEQGFVLTPANISLQLDLRQFFQHYRVLNAKYLAEKIGMNPTLLSQYVQGKKRPSKQQSDRIINGIQEIGKELSAMRLIM